MYRTFYGLNEPAFSPQPDARFLYLNEDRRRVLEMIEFAVRERAGFSVVSAKAGIGKTILIHALMKRLGDHVHAGLVTCMPGSRANLPGLVAAAFEIELSSTSASEAYRRIKNYIADLRKDGKSALLIIDNAHHLRPATFKLLVHLVDIDNSLQVILVGHPELRQLFSRRTLGDAAPRVIIQCEFAELNMVETDAYIRRRIVAAGGSDEIFSASAIKTIYQYSRGVPALINCACNFALEAGYEGKHQIIDESILSDLLDDRQDSDTPDSSGDQQTVTAVPVVADEATSIKTGTETVTRDESDISRFIRLSANHQHRQKGKDPAIDEYILSDLPEDRQDSDTPDSSGDQQTVTPAAVVADETIPLKTATEAVTRDESDISSFIRLSANHQRRQNRRLVYASVASFMLPAAAILWLFFHLRPGARMDSGVETQVSQNIESSPPAPLVRVPAESGVTEEIDKLEKINALNSLKATQSEVESRLAEQRVEQARIEAAMQHEQERILEAKSMLSEAPEPQPVPTSPAPAESLPAANALPEETDKLAMYNELKVRQYQLEQRLASQRLECNLIKEQIHNENERILKARAVIKKAYKGARFNWDQFNRTTPEPFPEDRIEH